MFKSEEELQKIQESFSFLNIKAFALFTKIGDIKNSPIKMYELYQGTYGNSAGPKKVKEFETLGLITITIREKGMYLMLTNKGKRLIKNLKKIKKDLNIKI